MSKVVYGVFDDAAAADRAIGVLETPDGFDAVVHRGHLREEDVQLGGTDALSGMIVGGLLVGGIAAVIAATLLYPLSGLSFDWLSLVLIVVGGSMFGVVAGAVAGASECRSSIRASATRVDRGLVLVTAEVDREAVGKVIAAFSEHGARDVRAA